jgi:hypothetical protein
MEDLMAQSFNLIVCDGPDCDFADLITLVKNLINAMVFISTLIVVGLLIYVGITLLTAGGDEGALKKAKGTFFQVVIGYLWILGGWLVIYTITSVLLSDKYYTFLGS